jgi:gliding motility-associated-like protein
MRQFSHVDFFGVGLQINHLFMKKILVFLLLCFLSTHNKGQNLIPDPLIGLGFSKCLPLYDTFINSKYWYESAGSPDMYLNGCTYDYNGIFLGQSTLPFVNLNGTIGVYINFKSDYTITGEVPATKLKAKLEANQLYYFSMNIQPRGIFHFLDNKPLFCPISPSLTLGIYTYSQKIQALKDKGGLAQSLNARRALIFQPKILSDTLASNIWTPLVGCFKAKGDETDLAIGFNFGAYDPVPPCVDSNIVNDNFNITYFLMDNFQLRHIRSYIQDTFMLCSDKKFVTVDFSTYFDSIGLEDLHPIWTDNGGFVREISSAGLHRFELDLDCGKVVFEFFVQPINCGVSTFVPNAFSPNLDGRNDLLIPFIDSEFPIKNYKFSVFDRWGNNCYLNTTNDGLIGWDGTIRGRQANEGIYTWSLSFDLIDLEGTKHHQLSGDVLLVR